MSNHSLSSNASLPSVQSCRRLRERRVASWAVSFERLLQDPLGVRYFSVSLTGSGHPFQRDWAGGAGVFPSCLSPRLSGPGLEGASLCCIRASVNPHPLPMSWVGPREGFSAPWASPAFEFVSRGTLERCLAPLVSVKGENQSKVGKRQHSGEVPPPLTGPLLRTI